MKKLKLINLLILFFLVVLNIGVSAKDFIIQGNDFTDDDILLSIIGEIPDENDKIKSNYILKQLNNSGLFKSVEVSFDNNNFYLKIKEFPSINKFFFKNNERIKDDDIVNIIEQLEVYTF